MNVRLYGSAVVAAILLGGCFGNNDETTALTPAPTASEFTGDALSKEIGTTSVSTELGANDRVFDVSASTEITNDDYTYNFSDDGGILAVQKIDWTTAVDAKKNVVTTANDDNLTSGYTDGDYNTTITDCSTLQKPIPKVICDVGNSLCLTYNITCLTEDVTVAVTPYKTILSMPNGAKFATDDNNSALVGISADVSVQNSSGKKLSIEDANKVVKLTSKITSKNSKVASDTYTLYKIKSMTPEKATITLTNTNSKLTSGYDLDGFYPYVIAKAMTYTDKSGSVTLGVTPLFDASIVVLDDTNKTIAQSKTDGAGSYGYKIPSATTSGKTKIFSNLLKNGVYETATILNGNLVIDSNNSTSVVKTTFTSEEQSEIKSLLGKKISSSYYSYDEPIEPNMFYSIVKPAELTSLMTSSTEMRNLGYPAINHFVKGMSVTDSSGTLSDGNGATYSIVATTDKLTISIVNTSTDFNHKYNENTTLTITKNSDGTFAFVISEYENNTYISSSGGSSENYIFSWTGKNNQIDVDGTQLQTISDGKVIGTFSSNHSSSYGSYGSSGSDNITFGVSKVGSEYIVSASGTLSDQKSDSSDSYSSSENRSYTMKAKYGIILDANGYAMSDKSTVSLENLTSKKVQGTSTIYDMQNVNITTSKDGSSVYINGIDASSW